MGVGPHFPVQQLAPRSQKDFIMATTPEHDISAVDAPKKSGGLLKLAAAGAIIGVLIVLGVQLDAGARLKEALDWIGGMGPAGPAIFILLYIVACVLFLPGSVLTLGAGAIWGLAWGTVYVSVGSTLGATAAFLVGRYFMRDWVSKKVETNPKFRAIDEAVAGEGWKIVGLTRLSPAFPFSLLNYAYGLTKVSLPQYVIASWIGMIPGTIMYVYIGAAAGDAAKGGNTPGQWALKIVGLLATVAVTVVITKIARNALKTRVSEEG